MSSWEKIRGKTQKTNETLKQAAKFQEGTRSLSKERQQK
jgi:hypothetical protein